MRAWFWSRSANVGAAISFGGKTSVPWRPRVSETVVVADGPLAVDEAGVTRTGLIVRERKLYGSAPTCTARTMPFRSIRRDVGRPKTSYRAEMSPLASRTIG